MQRSLRIKNDEVFLREAAEQMGVSESVLYNWRRLGHFIAAKRVSGWVIKKSALAKIAEAFEKHASDWHRHVQFTLEENFAIPSNYEKILGSQLADDLKKVSFQQPKLDGFSDDSGHEVLVSKAYSRGKSVVMGNISDYRPSRVKRLSEIAMELHSLGLVEIAANVSLVASKEMTA